MDDDKNKGGAGDGAGAGGDAGGGAAAPLLETLIPEEFREKPYLSELKKMPAGEEGYKALFKKLDGAETLLGRKIGIPAADAPETEVERFYSSLRPQKPEEYEFSAPKDGAAATDEEFRKAARTMFHEAGLSKTQAKKLADRFDSYVTEKSAPAIAEAKRLDDEFKVLSEKTFGADYAATLSRSQELLKELTPDTMKPFLAKLPNESLVLLAGVMEGVRAKFMKEDTGSGGGSGKGDGPKDVNALREELHNIYSSEAWKDYKHKDHEAVQKRAREVAVLMAKQGARQ